MVNIDDYAAKIVYSIIDSQSDWRKWYNSLDNKTYIIRHDLDVWHKSGPPHRCLLYELINRSMNSWGNASKLVRHDSRKQLWATIKLPNHFCVRCEKRLKLKKTECNSCRIRHAYAIKPFFEDYSVQETVLSTQEFEKGYRLFKFLEIKHKLAIKHFNCSTPTRCLHIRWYLKNRKSKLPEFRTKVIGDITYLVKEISFN